MLYPRRDLLARLPYGLPRKGNSMAAAAAMVARPRSWSGMESMTYDHEASREERVWWEDP